MRRDNGEGTIVQRADGTYAAALRVNGRRRRVYGKSEREARRKLAELQQLARQGHLADPGRHTVSNLLDAWLVAAEPSLKPRTLETYRQICAHHVKPAVGRIRLSKLTPDVVQRVITPLQKVGKGQTAEKTYRVLHRACEVATL